MRSVVAAALAAVALGAAGCSAGSGGSGEAAAPAHSASPTVAAGAQAAPGLPKGVKALTKVPADVPNDPALRSQVSVSSCSSVDGGWRAAGKATNPGTSPATYRITVFFTTSTATVIGTAHTRVTVKPGEDKEWTVSDAFAAPKKTLCVLRGVG